MEPVPCTSCSGESTVMAFDGIFYFLVCEKCRKIGPSAESEQGAVEMWNASGDSLFFYGATPPGTKLVRRIPCSERRDSARYTITLPFLMSVGAPTGPTVTGRIRNVSLYGAYLELNGGELSAVPVDDAALPVMYLHVAGEDVAPSEQAPGTFEKTAKQEAVIMAFQPVRVEWHRQSITMGGRFIQQREEHRQFMEALITAQSTAHKGVQA